MNKHNGNEKGFTLIEVLLSIILLSIILTSFVGFFTQSAIFTKKNGQKLSTMQTAQLIVKMIDSSVTLSKLKDSDVLTSDEYINNENGIYHLENVTDIQNKLGITLDQSVKDSGYNFDLVFTNKEFPSEVTYTTSTVSLIQVEVIVKQGSGGQGSQSNTYTYIRE